MTVTEMPITKQARWYRLGGNLPIIQIVIHDEEHPVSDKSAEGVAAMFASSVRQASCHYVVDGDSRQHCVPDGSIAFHAPPNKGRVGIERDGYATFTREQWLAPSAMKAGLNQAQLTAELCVLHDIPPVKLTVAQVKAGKKGICGHVDVSLAFRQSSHTDPGPGFPWPEFMACVVDAYNRLTGAAPKEPFTVEQYEDIIARLQRIEDAIRTGGKPIGALTADNEAAGRRRGRALGAILEHEGIPDPNK